MAVVADRRELRSRQVGRVTQPRSFWPWFIQRVTGVVLVVLLTIHIGVLHFGNLNKPGVKEGTRELIVFSDVAYRLSMALWWVVDVSLLVFVLYHGLNGMRNIALDMGVKSGGDKAITAALTVVGVAAFAFGMAGLIAFQRYR